MRLERRRGAGKTAKRDECRDLGRPKGYKREKKAVRMPEVAEGSENANVKMCIHVFHMFIF